MNPENISLLAGAQASASVPAPVFSSDPGFLVFTMQKIHSFLKSKGWEFTGDVLVTLFCEPWAGTKAGWYMHQGLEGRNIAALNPRELTPEQLQLSPVLLIHGDCSKAGIWWPMIQKINTEVPNKAIFTVDLTSADGRVKPEYHLQILVNKVKEIRALYPPESAPRVSFVGHSNGGYIIPHLVNALENEGITTQGAIIRIGAPLTPESEDAFPQLRDRTLEIVGSKDIFGDRSQLPRCMRATSCHVSLLFNEQVKNWVVEELRAA